MKKIPKKQLINSLLFAIGGCGIDYTIKANNNVFAKSFHNDMTKITIYYIIMFILLFVFCNIVYEKIKRLNNKGR